MLEHVAVDVVAGIIIRFSHFQNSSLIHAIERLNQNRQKHRKQNERSKEDLNNEEERRGGIRQGHRSVHERHPEILRQKLERRVERVEERREGGAVLVVGLDDVSKERISQKRKDEEIQKDDQKKVERVSHGGEGDANERTNRRELLEQLQNAEKSQSAEDGEDAAAGKPEFDERADDDRSVENVEGGLDVLLEAKTHQAQNHLTGEDDGEDEIRVVLRRVEPLGLVEVLRGEHDGVQNDAKNDELREVALALLHARLGSGLVLETARGLVVLARLGEIFEIGVVGGDLAEVGVAAGDEGEAAGDGALVAFGEFVRPVAELVEFFSEHFPLVLPRVFV